MLPQKIKGIKLHEALLRFIKLFQRYEPSTDFIILSVSVTAAFNDPHQVTDPIYTYRAPLRVMTLWPQDVPAFVYFLIQCSIEKIFQLFNIIRILVENCCLMGENHAFIIEITVFRKLCIFSFLINKIPYVFLLKNINLFLRMLSYTIQIICQ